MVELSVLGISLQEEGTSPVLLLHPLGTERVLSMGIGPMEAFAISTALHSSDLAARLAGKSAVHQDSCAAPLPSFPFPRPMTHDLLSNIILTLGGVLVCIDITRVVDGAYIAEAVITQGRRELRVDCRPSDGIAVALRSGAAIRASAEVLEHSESMDQVMAALPEHVRTIAAAKLAALGRSERSAMRIPEIVEKAVSARAATRQDGGMKGNLVSVAQKMMQDELGRDDLDMEALLEEVEKRAARRIKVDSPPPSPREAAGHVPVVKVTPGSIKIPQIRVSLVRQKLDDAPQKGGIVTGSQDLSDEALTALGLSRREAEAVMGAPDSDRWAMLLRFLAPETKVPM